MCTAALCGSMAQARHDIRQGDVVIVWASPPCQAYSRLQITGTTKVSGRKPSESRTEEGRRQADRAVHWLFMLCRCGPVCSLASFAASGASQGALPDFFTSSLTSYYSQCLIRDTSCLINLGFRARESIVCLGCVRLPCGGCALGSAAAPGAGGDPA